MVRHTSKDEKAKRMKRKVIFVKSCAGLMGGAGGRLKHVGIRGGGGGGGGNTIRQAKQMGTAEGANQTGSVKGVLRLRKTRGSFRNRTVNPQKKKKKGKH